MADDKSAVTVMGSSSRERERDRELLIPVANSSPSGRNDDDDSAKPSPSASSSHHSGRETFYKVIRSWASKKFMTGCVILFPIAVTFYITWWFIHFVDGFFSPIYAQLGIDIFGLGFITSITFIFLVGVFMSSWLGTSVLSLGEWFIKRMPFVRHIYDASKQISSAISPDQNSQAFKEVAIIRHPRIGEYAFGFITSSVMLQAFLHLIYNGRIILVRKTYAVFMFPPIICILGIFSWSTQEMLSDQICRSVKELVGCLTRLVIFLSWVELLEVIISMAVG